MEQTLQQTAEEYAHEVYVNSSEIEEGELVNAFIEGAEWQKKQSSWINVKEALPKVGDVVIMNYDTTDGNNVAVINEIKGCNIYVDNATGRHKGAFGMAEIAHLATPEEIAKWNKEVLEPNHLHYSKSKRKIIHWFLPFDKIVVRESSKIPWYATFFSHCISYVDGCMLKNINNVAYAPCDCLPYNEKTAKLIGTTDDYEEE